MSNTACLSASAKYFLDREYPHTDLNQCQSEIKSHLPPYVVLAYIM